MSLARLLRWAAVIETADSAHIRAFFATKQPTVAASLASDELSEAEELRDVIVGIAVCLGRSRMTGAAFSLIASRPGHKRRTWRKDGRTEDDDESYDDGAIFDDDIFAAGEMRNVPFYCMHCFGHEPWATVGPILTPLTEYLHERTPEPITHEKTRLSWQGRRRRASLECQ